LLTSLGIYAIICRATPSCRVLAVFIATTYLFTPMSAVLAAWPFTDHGMSFMLLSAVMATIETVSNPTARRWILTGILTGGLLGTKYTMGPIGVAILLFPLAKYRTRSQLQHLALAAFAAGIIGGIWYIKNFWYTGNPFYPLASQWFPGGEWTAEANKFLHGNASQKGMGKGFSDFLLTPFQATFNWTAFEAQNPGATLIIITVGNLLSLLYIRKATCVAKGSLLLLSIIYLIWFASYHSNRLLLPFTALALTTLP